MKRHPTQDRLARSPIHLLHRAGQCAEDLFHAEIKDRCLTPRLLAVLVTVARTEGLSQTGLVARTGIDRSTLADIVRRMQRKGLLQRRPLAFQDLRLCQKTDPGVAVPDLLHPRSHRYRQQPDQPDLARRR